MRAALAWLATVALAGLLTYVLVACVGNLLEASGKLGRTSGR